MSDLDRIITINIDRQTTAVSQAGFGVALILGADGTEKPAGQTTRVRRYTADSFADDFADTTEVYKALAAYFGQELKPTEAVVGFVEGVETVAAALNAIDDEDSDFYAVGITSRLDADILALAAWIATQRRIGAVASDDADILNGALDTDAASVLNAAAYDRTFLIYSSNADTQYPEFAWLGRMLPTLPGSATWKFKTLTGITFDKLSATSLAALTAKKANWYNRVGGVNITEEGWMASGEFIDVIRGVDWIHARMQEAIFSRLVNLAKIPYTNAGVGIIVNEMEGVLRRAVNQGILSGERAPTVTAPLVEDIAFNDRAARLLPDVTFLGFLAGAIHKTTINGIVTV